ncbi:hypothetical protein [Tenacibaculum maritimum]|uniref:hypothetical protein n=1 Tax=Tenacibaculum maritimum TaxID=107401 RepID=UPI0012E4539E|nr:hypothetical protein [Tenacibaculum maritimum]MCD9622166.1 hypothetical protein [Tenacibaculum maritimum]MCD9628614.1 hypothetical protein [Tenacibaculum maritimum]MCD9631537.1 hypothetical protein [Tenacibaculum maritimum]MCD9634443.1 hypothetical protein [Tenacibaculum maritimum]CAA0223465.1 hypothetical protein FS0810_340001 [Tenacibaculum maritimum]
MNQAEKIFKYPIPNYIDYFDDSEGLSITPYAVSYQYSIDNNGIGPYGFNTIKAKKLTDILFSNIKLWNGTIFKEGLQSMFGVSFYYDNSFIEEQEIELKKYFSLKKKNLLFERFGKPTTPLNTPFIFDLIQEKKFNSKKINKLLDINPNFFLNVKYSPEGGQTMLFFNEEIWSKIKEFCVENEINYSELNSIDNLKSW